METLEVGDGGDERAPDGACGEDDVCGTDGDGGAGPAAVEVDSPPMRSGVVRRGLLDFGTGPHGKVLDGSVVFEPVCELVSRSELGPIGRIWLVQH